MLNYRRLEYINEIAIINTICVERKMEQSIAGKLHHVGEIIAKSRVWGHRDIKTHKCNWNLSHSKHIIALAGDSYHEVISHVMVAFNHSMCNAFSNSCVLRAARGMKRELIKFKIFEMVRVWGKGWLISKRLHRIVRRSELAQNSSLPRYDRQRQLSHDIQTCEHTVWKSVARIISNVIRLSE